MSLPAPKPKAPRALLVDDDEAHNKIMVAILAKLGIETAVSTSAKAFLLQLKESKANANICLVDLNIDSLGVGYTLIKAIRKVLGSQMPVIVLSGHTDSKAVAHGVEVGANDFITKPIDRTVLASKLTRYLVTDQLLGMQAPFFPVPEGGSPATINLEFELKEVDEFGITIASRHLLNKGSSFRIDGPLLHEITGSAEAHLFTVSATWVQEDGASYAAFAEFDTANSNLLASVRRWLSQKH